MFTLAFWKMTGERAVKTLAQTLLSLWVVGDGFNLLNVDWMGALGVGLGATLASVLTSVASAGINTSGTPSLVDETPAGRHEAV